MADTAARLTTLTRLGFAARALIYIVISILVITTGRATDPAGAIRYLSQGGGSLLILIIAIGLLAYGLWRLSDALLNIERHGSDKSGVVERLGAGASGLIHLLLAWQAFKLFQGLSDSNGDAAQEGAQSVLQYPGGGPLLIVGGAILLATGVFQFFKAAKASYLKDLEPHIARQPWAKWSGRLGYAARGLVFIITGFFLTSAGLNEQASEAGDMSSALSWLDNPWDMIVATGFFAFGLFSLIEARYRILHAVPVQSLGQKIKAKFS